MEHTASPYPPTPLPSCWPLDGRTQQPAASLTLQQTAQFVLHDFPSDRALPLACLLHLVARRHSSLACNAAALDSFFRGTLAFGEFLQFIRSFGQPPLCWARLGALTLFGLAASAAGGAPTIASLVPWFFGHAGREEIEAALARQPPGSYGIRYSSINGALVLSSNLAVGGQPHHCLVWHGPPAAALGKGPPSGWLEAGAAAAAGVGQRGAGPPGAEDRDLNYAGCPLQFSNLRELLERDKEKLMHPLASQLSSFSRMVFGALVPGGEGGPAPLPMPAPAPAPAPIAPIAAYKMPGGIGATAGGSSFVPSGAAMPAAGLVSMPRYQGFPASTPPSTTAAPPPSFQTKAIAAIAAPSSPADPVAPAPAVGSMIGRGFPEGAVAGVAGGGGGGGGVGAAGGVGRSFPQPVFQHPPLHQQQQQQQAAPPSFPSGPASPVSPPSHPGHDPLPRTGRLLRTGGTADTGFTANPVSDATSNPLPLQPAALPISIEPAPPSVGKAAGFAVSAALAAAMGPGAAAPAAGIPSAAATAASADPAALAAASALSAALAAASAWQPPLLRQKFGEAAWAVLKKLCSQSLLSEKQLGGPPPGTAPAPAAAGSRAGAGTKGVAAGAGKGGTAEEDVLDLEKDCGDIVRTLLQGPAAAGGAATGSAAVGAGGGAGAVVAAPGTVTSSPHPSSTSPSSSLNDLWLCYGPLMPRLTKAHWSRLCKRHKDAGTAAFYSCKPPNHLQAAGHFSAAAVCAAQAEELRAVVSSLLNVATCLHKEYERRQKEMEGLGGAAAGGGGVALGLGGYMTVSSSPASSAYAGASSPSSSSFSSESFHTGMNALQLQDVVLCGSELYPSDPSVLPAIGDDAVSMLYAAWNTAQSESDAGQREQDICKVLNMLFLIFCMLGRRQKAHDVAKEHLRRLQVSQNGQVQTSTLLELQKRIRSTQPQLG